MSLANGPERALRQSAGRRIAPQECPQFCADCTELGMVLSALCRQLGGHGGSPTFSSWQAKLRSTCKESNQVDAGLQGMEAGTQAFALDKWHITMAARLEVVLEPHEEAVCSHTR